MSLKGDVVLKPIPDADGAEGVAVAGHAGLRVEPGHPGRPVVPLFAQLAVHARRVALKGVQGDPSPHGPRLG